MSSIQTQLLADLYRESFQRTLDLAPKVPEQARLLQLKEGKNHPLWLIGHLANTIEVVGNHWALGLDYTFGKQFGFLFAPDFAGGREVTAEAEVYPGWDEVVAAYREASERYLENLVKVTDEELPEKPRNPVRGGLEKHFSSIEVIAHTMIFHDNHHRGQISMMANLVG